MNKDKYVFAQLVERLDCFRFRRIVRKYMGDRYVKSFSCWNQLLVMMYGQLSNRRSLRDLIIALDVHRGKWYHMGFGTTVTRSNLAKANEQRDCRIFEEFAYDLIAEARSKIKDRTFNLGGSVYAFDSTTIDLCLEVYRWARFRKNKGGVKMHTLYDLETQIPAFVHITPAAVHDVKAMPKIQYEDGAYYIFDRGYNDFANLFRIEGHEATFIIRAKKNLQFERISWSRRLPKNVRSDSTIRFTTYKSSKEYSKELRRVVYWDEEQKREFVFLTNNFELTALTVAEMYHNRWKVELFFKWLKQHLKIEKFWGTSMNAVKIQIYCAIITYCLVAIIKHDMKLDHDIYVVLQALSVSLSEKRHLKDLFDKSNFSNVKELDNSCEPSLFNF